MVNYCKKLTYVKTSIKPQVKASNLITIVLVFLKYIFSYVIKRFIKTILQSVNVTWAYIVRERANNASIVIHYYNII